jgi:hypothetical protein
MASHSRRFTAKQYGAPHEEAGIQSVLDPSIDHKLKKLVFVFDPSEMPLLVTIKKSLCGRQQEFVEVGSAAQFIEEELKIITFGKTGQLRNVVQPDVD